MRINAIPSTFGLLTLTLAGSGCTDAARVAETFGKICKEQCECPDNYSFWNEISNCKKACEGYSLYLEAYIDDSITTEPCSTLGEALREMRACTKKSCGEERYECLSSAYYDLFDCWPLYADPYGASFSEDDGTGQSLSSGELMQQLLHPIPHALDAATLHSATQ